MRDRYSEDCADEETRHKPVCGKKLWTRDMCESRFYDFVVSTERKRVEKLRYIHRNPVKRGVLEPYQWAWSSFRWYAHGERGTGKTRSVKDRGHPPFENRKGWGSLKF